MNKAVGLKYVSVGHRPTLDLESILSPVVGVIIIIWYILHHIEFHTPYFAPTGLRNVMLHSQQGDALR